jgi:hypothetical protein
VNQPPKIFVCLLAFAAGCNSGPEFAEVQGTVRVNGKPLDQLMIVFIPDTGTAGPDSFGYTDDKGHYTLTSHTNIPGAVVGTHRVVVRDMILLDEALANRREKAGQPPLQSRVSLKYDAASETPLRFDVKAGPRNTIDLDVTGP